MVLRGLRRDTEDFIMTRFIKAVFAASVFAASIGPAIAQDGAAYPLSVADGENSAILHGPGHARGTLVGGGRVVATANGENTQLQHLDSQFAQPAATGLVAVSVGSGEDSSVVFVPAGTFTLGLFGNGAARQ
jgi:hypothetical protein